MFAALFTLSLAHVVLRTVSVALLFFSSPVCLVAILLAEMGLYLCFLAVRRDFYYWIPNSGWLVALFARVIGKIFSDFTGIVHMRHPYDLGGVYWCFSIILNQLTSFVAGSLYSKWYYGPDKIDSTLLFLFLGGLVTLWVLAFGTFLFMIEPMYVRTFFSWQTASAHASDLFVNNVDDAKRAAILGVNAKLWHAIQEDVKDWIQGNLVRWQVTRPHWFTGAFVASIPEDFLTQELKDSLNGSAWGQGGRRRSLETLSFRERLGSLSAAAAADDEDALTDVYGQAEAAQQQPQLADIPAIHSLSPRPRSQLSDSPQGTGPLSPRSAAQGIAPPTPRATAFRFLASMALSAPADAYEDSEGTGDSPTSFSPTGFTPSPSSRQEAVNPGSPTTYLQRSIASGFGATFDAF